VATDVAAAVRAHEHKHKAARFIAVDGLSRAVMRGEKPGLAVYGAAELADLLFRETGVNAGRVAAIFDSDTRKHGTLFGGLPVRPPSDIPEVDPAVIVILSSAEADIRRTIEAAGFRGRIVPWSDLG
jgi:FlaA1/EpsC-like NDP-sugar epimerase